MNIKKQTVRMYLYEAALAFRMVDAVWVIFLLERGFTLAQAGIAEGVFHITSMIFEVPSGMAADLFGRKRTLIMSGVVGICGAVLMTLNGWSGFVYCGMITGRARRQAGVGASALRTGRCGPKRAHSGRCHARSRCDGPGVPPSAPSAAGMPRRLFPRRRCRSGREGLGLLLRCEPHLGGVRAGGIPRARAYRDAHRA